MLCDGPPNASAHPRPFSRQHGGRRVQRMLGRASADAGHFSPTLQLPNVLQAMRCARSATTEVAVMRNQNSQ